MEQIFKLQSIVSSNLNYSTEEYANTANTLVPIAGYLPTCDVINDKLSFYKIVKAYDHSYRIRRSNTYSNFYNFFTNLVSCNDYIYLTKKIRGTEDEYLKYYGFPGGITDQEGNILSMMTFYSDAHKEIRRQCNRRDYDDIDKGLFCLLINKDIFAGEHKELYKAFEKFFIKESRAQGIDIIETSHMDALCFNKAVVKIPHFNDFEEEEQHLLTISPLIYDKPEEIRTDRWLPIIT